MPAPRKPPHAPRHAIIRLYKFYMTTSGVCKHNHRCDLMSWAPPKPGPDGRRSRTAPPGYGMQSKGRRGSQRVDRTPLTRIRSAINYRAMPHATHRTPPYATARTHATTGVSPTLLARATACRTLPRSPLAAASAANGPVTTSPRPPPRSPRAPEPPARIPHACVVRGALVPTRQLVPTRHQHCRSPPAPRRGCRGRLTLHALPPVEIAPIQCRWKAYCRLHIDVLRKCRSITAA